MDSKVIASQIDKTFQIKVPKLVRYMAAVGGMEKHFLGFTVKSISRNDNFEADDLAKAVARNLSIPLDVFYQKLRVPVVEVPSQKAFSVAIIESKDWHSPIMAYLCSYYEPEDNVEAEHMAQRARNYKIVGDDLYKIGVCAPMRRCISQVEGQNLLREIHGGLCGSHVGTRALVGEAFRQGFFWPKAVNDVEYTV